MESFATEEEQFAAIKKWLAKNLQWIIFALSIFLVVYFGRSYLQQASIQENHEAFVLHSELTEARQAYLDAESETADSEISDSEAQASLSTEKNAFLMKLDQLKTDFKDHALTELAVLSASAVLVEKEQYDLAEEELRWLIDNKPNPEIAELAGLRLAQVLFQKTEFDQALDVIEANLGEGKGYQNALLELQGDIFLMQEQPEKALSSYKAAKSVDDVISSHQALQWKIDDLAGVDDQ